MSTTVNLPRSQPTPSSCARLGTTSRRTGVVLHGHRSGAGSSGVSTEGDGRGGEVPARLCTDAYLAAIAMANGWPLVSFDRDFERFDLKAWRV